MTVINALSGNKKMTVMVITHSMTATSGITMTMTKKTKTTTARENKRKKNRESKRSGRAKTKDKYGPPLETSLHTDSRERLLEIAQLFDDKDYSGLSDRKQGNVFRAAIGNLVNTFYIDNVYKPESETAQLLCKIYHAYHKLAKKHPPEEILAKLKDIYPSPFALIS